VQHIDGRSEDVKVYQTILRQLFLKLRGKVHSHKASKRIGQVVVVVVIDDAFQEGKL